MDFDMKERNDKDSWAAYEEEGKERSADGHGRKRGKKTDRTNIEKKKMRY